jgi:hypothetical protein
VLSCSAAAPLSTGVGAQREPADESGAVAPEGAETRRLLVPGSSRVAVVTRIVSHLVVWSAVLVPTVAELSSGWQAFGDDAAIASRSYQVFTVHPPLTGLASAASHHLFDPGPLMFILLSGPVHIDPTHGLLWGAALVSGLVLSLAIEAAWASGRWLTGAVVALTVLDLLWLTPQVFDNLAWNAYLPLPFLLASVVFAWLVCNGATKWWPVLVFTASAAAESHLFFVVPAAALVVVSLAFGLLAGGRPRRLGWIAVGLLVGLLCWLAPIIQQLEGPQGNLTAILHANHGQPTLGVSFALRDIGLAAALHPVWLTHLPSGFFPLAAQETAYPAWYGGLVLGLLAVIAAVAIATGRRALGSLSALTCGASAGFFVSLAVFPQKNILSLAYLLDALWGIGILLWLIAGWAVVATGGFVASRRRGPARDPSTGTVGVLEPLFGVGVVALLVAAVLIVRPAGTHPAEVGWSTPDVDIVTTAVSDIERAVPPGPISVAVANPDFYTRTWSAEAVAYRLEYQGWHPGTSSDAAAYTGLTISPASPGPRFLITVRANRVVSVIETG